MSIETPYFHRGPIRKPEHFFGRTQEITNTLSLLKNNQSVSIVGPRRMGKTSFLLHISHPEVMARHGLFFRNERPRQVGNTSKERLRGDFSLLRRSK